MEIGYSTGRQTRQTDLLRELLRKKGIERFGLFLVSGEGRTLPDGLENASGHVVDESGRVHFFWMDWDDGRGEMVLRTFEPVMPETDWVEEPEYRAAREAAGL